MFGCFLIVSTSGETSQTVQDTLKTPCIIRGRKLESSNTSVGNDHVFSTTIFYQSVDHDHTVHHDCSRRHAHTLPFIFTISLVIESKRDSKGVPLTLSGCRARNIRFRYMSLASCELPANTGSVLIRSIIC